MNEKRRCLVGRDDGDAAGWLIALAIAVIVIMTIVAIMVYAGIFIGGFHSIKNYLTSLKHNVIDSNRKPKTTH